MFSPKHFTILSLVLIFFVPVCFASESYIDSIIVDKESFKHNEWGIFDVTTDVDTPSDDICEDITLSYQFFSPRGIFVMDYPDEVIEVCGTDYHAKKQIMADIIPDSDTSKEDDPDNEFGIFACSQVEVTGNGLVDSFDFSSGQYGSSNILTNGNIYSNGTIKVSGNATVEGSLFAPDIDVQGNATVTGEVNTGNYFWDCVKANMDAVYPIVLELNDNSKNGTSNIEKLHANSNIRVSSSMKSKDEITLTSGIYYFDELNINGNTRLYIDGKVMIFSNGSVTLSGNAEINPIGNPKDLAIYSIFDDIVVQGTVEISASLFAPYGTIELNGNSNVFGAAFADKIFISGTSSLHFNEHNYNHKLNFMVGAINDKNGELVDQKLAGVFLMKDEPREWEVIVEDGQFTHVYTHGNGSKQTVRTPLLLKGFGDYFIVNELYTFIQAANDAGSDPIFSILSHYDFWEWPDKHHVGQMNYYRIFPYFFSVADDAINLRGLPHSTIDQYCQPWEYYRDIYQNHVYHMYQAQNCNNVPGYYLNCWWNRMEKFIEDAYHYGVVVEINFFDRAMAEREEDGYYYWTDHPFNPNNQKWDEENEINWYVGKPNFSKEMYRARYSDAASGPCPNLIAQQNALIDITVDASSEYPVVIYQPMNEPEMEKFAGYNDPDPGDWCHTNPCNSAIMWHDWVTSTANISWQNHSIYDDDFKAGLNLYCYSQTDFNCINYFFNGNGSIYKGQFDIPNHQDFKYVSYHTPYYQGPGTCVEYIHDLKEDHFDTFPSKACIVDTDGDDSPDAFCRNDPDTIYNPSVPSGWAYETYECSETEKSASYNTKGQRYIPGGPQGQPGLDKRIMQRIDQALADTHEITPE